MNILITAGTSATAMKLSKAFTGQKVLLADYGDVPNLVSESYQFATLGILNKDVLAHNLLTFCLDNNIDYLLPLNKFEIEALIVSITLFEEFGIKVLLPKKDSINAFLADSIAIKNWVMVKDAAVFYASSENIEVSSNLLLKASDGAFAVDLDNNLLTLIAL